MLRRFSLRYGVVRLKGYVRLKNVSNRQFGRCVAHHRVQATTVSSIIAVLSPTPPAKPFAIRLLVDLYGAKYAFEPAIFYFSQSWRVPPQE